MEKQQKQQNEGSFSITTDDNALWEVDYTRSTHTDKVYLDYYNADKDVSFINYVCQVDLPLDELESFASFQIGDR